MTATHGLGTEPVPFRVLAVCTANVCRSPMIGAMLRSTVGPRTGENGYGDWQIATAGTSVPDGWSTSSEVIDVLARRGIPLIGRPARQVTARLLGQADLVLTAERSHRAWIVRQSPAMVHRTFTLLQFARLCEAGLAGHPGGNVLTGPALLSVALAGRSRLQPAPDSEESLTDPIGLGSPAFDECADRVAAALRQMFPTALPASNARRARDRYGDSTA